MDPRIKAFADELTALLAKYSDTERGARGHLLFISMVALMDAEKGSLCTPQEVAQLCVHSINTLPGTEKAAL